MSSQRATGGLLEPAVCQQQWSVRWVSWRIDNQSQKPLFSCDSVLQFESISERSLPSVAVWRSSCSLGSVPN
ncbi:hypothetical protein CesoFtcFv8_006797 [Champsocephalus esox]|nr:hypothetical protein CesoFtcFv8_006797 [Champsocephalus esox]